MSTPVFTIQNGSYSAVSGDPVFISGVARDSGNLAVDLSSGYSARVLVQSNPVKVSITPATVVLNADGTFKLTLSGAQSATLPIGTRNFYVELSNDSFSTQACVQRGQISTLDPNGVQ